MQAFGDDAELHAANGLCGDITHVDSCRVSDCAAEKWLVVFKTSGEYSIIHAEPVAPWDAAGPMRADPLVLPPTTYSLGFVEYMRSIEGDVQVEVECRIRSQITVDKIKDKQRIAALDSAPGAAKTPAELETAHPFTTPRTTALACRNVVLATAFAKAQSSSGLVSKDEQAVFGPGAIEADWSDVEVSDDEEFEVIAMETL
ncbi:hypothetical protein LTR53_015889 [Teratosphaeriaceae sp. CCFEE 6253]|nr:hypothetical protein LTR53_015889 [Teratosphaeriaceae sp. CCFEE 6253]